jgi:hypothetical protein
MRKPNYNFERSQRDGAKRAKAEAKAQKRAAEKEQAAIDAGEVPPAADTEAAEPNPETADK